MTEKKPSGVRFDFVLLLIAIVILILAIWVWMMAMPIARETIVLATTLALIISLILVVNVAVLVMMRLQRRITHLEEVLAEGDSPETTETEVIVVTLTNTERRIINRLEENGGQMAQDELRRATGLSKSTLSVTLSGLERKSLISRIESGRTKIVTLEKTVPR